MKQFFRDLSKNLYRYIAKPIFFKLSPDFAHSFMIKVSKVLQYIPGINWLIHTLIVDNKNTKDNKVDIEQKLAGVTYKGPVGLTAGFDKNLETVGMMKAVGFSFMEGGTITYKPYKGNPKPWFYRLPNSKSLVVNAGLANQGAPKILARLSKIKNKWHQDFPINISVGKTNCKENANEDCGINDYISTLKLLKNHLYVDAITLNISCPNVYGGEPFTTPRSIKKLLTEVDKLDIKKPIWIKMPIDKTDAEFKELLDEIVKHKITGVTISNLFKDRKKVELKDKLPDSVKGNLSGFPTQKRSNELIALTYKNYKDKLYISGVGGIFSAEDAYEKIKNGANLVQLITGVIFNGPQLPAQINHDLKTLLEKDGYSNIKEAIGSNFKKQSDIKSKK